MTGPPRRCGPRSHSVIAAVPLPMALAASALVLLALLVLLVLMLLAVVSLAVLALAIIGRRTPRRVGGAVLVARGILALILPRGNPDCARVRHPVDAVGISQLRLVLGVTRIDREIQHPELVCQLI